tara:strand:- start:316 stop:1116 length:801 start_codon:yes stop_codon:yes gene_type:complete
MKKILTIFLISAISQGIILNVFAGSDGTLEINKAKEQTNEVKDCFETVNRGIFAFNQGLDKVFFKPVAKGYRYLPKPIRSGTSNAISNLSNVITVPNNILQGQIKEAGINALRFSINSTLGIAGIFDVASFYGLNKLEKEDYGQTLGTWGVKEGCYFVLPVLGPTTVRDSLGSMINFSGGDAWYNVTVTNNTKYFENSDYYYSRLTSGIDYRAKNLNSFESLEENSLDLYASVRSLYLQDRKRKILNLDETTVTMNDDDWEEIDTQ